MGLQNLFKCFQEMEDAKGGASLVANVKSILPEICDVLANQLSNASRQVEILKTIDLPNAEDNIVR